MNYNAGTGGSKDGYSYPAKSMGNTNCNLSKGEVSVEMKWPQTSQKIALRGIQQLETNALKFGSFKPQ